MKVFEERERLEELNEEIEEGKGKGKDGDEDRKILSEEEIDERCEELRAKLLKELEEDAAAGSRGKSGPVKDRRQLKSYQVHELAEAKIEESERLRRALGIREDRETGELSSGRPERRRE